MKDRSTLGAHAALALIAAVAGFAGFARAQEAGAPSSTPDVPAEASVPEAVPSPPTAEPIAVPEPPASTPVLPPAAPPAASDTSAAELTGAAWFARPRLMLSAGEGRRGFKLRFFGFLAADYFTDSTRSYADSMGSSLVARTDTYEYQHGRTQFSLKSTRLGFGFDAPTMGTVTPSAVIEADFAGNQEAPPATSETTYFAKPLFRIRHAYVKVKSPYVDLLMGHTFDVFGWQSYFDPSGLRNQLFSRNPQLRLSSELNAEGAVTFEIAAAAVRPVQRDSGVPDLSGGLRFSWNGWQGIRTPGNERIVAMPLTLGISGIVRQFKVNAFTQPPIQTSNHATGWGLSFDAFLPVIPASNLTDRGNRLAFMGSYVRGTGIADLLGITGGAQFIPLDQFAYPAPAYLANVDQGILAFTPNGVVHTIDWTAIRVGLQYYLPYTGRWIFSANYTQAHSGNLRALYPENGVEVAPDVRVADTLRYADAKLSYDITPVMRVGVGGQYTQTVYLDGQKPRNLRLSGQAIYLF